MLGNGSSKPEQGKLFLADLWEWLLLGPQFDSTDICGGGWAGNSFCGLRIENRIYSDWLPVVAAS